MRLLTFIPILAFACLVLFRLDHAAFWDDEAHVALCARALLATHTATAWDGRNLMPDSNGAGLNGNLEIYFVQLDNAVAAAAFKLLGDSPWAGRLPFALCGIATLMIFRSLLRLEYSKAPALQVYALIIAATSVNLLLYCRNCRYYGLSLLVTALIFHGYRRFLDRRQWRCAILIGLWSGLLVLTNILNAISVLGALAVRHRFFHRREFSRADWMKVGAAAVLVAAISIPYAVRCILPALESARKFDSISGGTPPPFWLWGHLVIFWWNLEGMNLINAIPWTLALTLTVALVKTYRAPVPNAPVPDADIQATAAATMEFAGALVGFAFFLALATPQNIWRADIPEVRYLTPMLPFMAVISAAALWFIDRWSRPAALALLTVLITSNALSLVPNVPFRWQLPAWLRETATPFPTSCSETIAYLKQHARQDDTVWFCPSYMGKPLMYYLGGRIKLRGILDRRTVLCEEGIQRLEPAMFIENVYPDWIIAFGCQPELADALARFTRPHTEHDESVRYDYPLEETLPVYWKQTQRPEAPWHTFGPGHEFDPAREAVFIYKKSKACSSATALQEPKKSEKIAP